MKKISDFKGSKILSKNEQKEINGSMLGGPYCINNACYISLPTGQFRVGICRFGNCIFY